MSVLCNFNCGHHSQFCGISLVTSLLKDKKRCREWIILIKGGKYWHKKGFYLTVSSSCFLSSGYQQTFQQKPLKAMSFVIPKQGFEFKPKNLRSCTMCHQAKPWRQTSEKQTLYQQGMHLFGSHIVKSRKRGRVLGTVGHTKRLFKHWIFFMLV